MTKLYLIRHAEAEGNLYRRIHGHYDSLVTDNGYRQIQALQERFRSVHIDAVYSSDLFRTMTTAKSITVPKQLTLHTRKALREIAMGVWEDCTWGEIDHKDRANMVLFCQTSPQWQIEGSETFDQVRTRVSNALLEIAKNHPNQTVAVFCHGTAIRNAMAVFLGLSIEEGRSLGHSDNTAVTLLEFEDGNVRIAFADDNSHLDESISTLARQGWWKNKGGTSPDENLWYDPMDLSQEEQRRDYLEARRESWLDLHRDLSDFPGQDYLEAAQKIWEENPYYLVYAMQKGNRVGILQLDPHQYADQNAGYIRFFYMFPESRHHGLGIQLVGQATSVYRPMGLKKLRLLCGQDNQVATRFYQRYGFHVLKEHQTKFAALNLMEKYIGY